MTSSEDEPPELEVVEALDVIVEVIDDLVERREVGDGVHLERPDHLQRELVDDAEAAETDDDGVEVGVAPAHDAVVALGVDEAQRDDLIGEAAEPEATSVRPGRDRAGEGLFVD